MTGITFILLSPLAVFVAFVAPGELTASQVLIAIATGLIGLSMGVAFIVAARRI